MKHLRQNYCTEVQIRTAPGADLSTVYWDFTGPAGLSDVEVHARAARAALAEVPGEVVGSRVITDGHAY